MSKEELLDSIGQVNDKFVEEAAPKGLLANTDTAVEQEKKSAGITKLYPYLKWGSLAACLCIIVGLTMRSGLFSGAQNDMAFDSAVQMKPSEEKSVKAEAEFPFYNEETNNGNKDYAQADMDSAFVDSTTNFSETVSEDTGFPDWGLTLSVKNVSSTGLTLVVTQSGGNPSGEIMTGEPYRLITLADDTWKVVEELPLPDGVDGRAFNSIGYLIQNGETREFVIDWNWIFGELPKGTYRLIKEFMDFRETANYDTFEYWVEFVIE